MSSDETEKRLRKMEDIEEIKCLQNEYLFYVLNRQWEEIPDFFTDDAEVWVSKMEPAYGREQIARLFTERISKANAGKDRDGHFTVMPVINVDGDKANGHWMIYIFIADPSTGNVTRYAQGRYDNEYRRENGSWKFSKLVYTNPWPLTPESQPRPEQWQ
jgi:ketosteroid isomerase-like protein